MVPPPLVLALAHPSPDFTLVRRVHGGAQRAVEVF